jgi:hypothetical protein
MASLHLAHHAPLRYGDSLGTARAPRTIVLGGAGGMWSLKV